MTTENDNQQHLLYDLPDDQSSAFHQQPTSNEIDRRDVLRNNAPESRLPTRGLNQCRLISGNRHFYCVFLFFILTLVMLTLGIGIGSVIFHKFGDKCVKQRFNDTSLIKLTFEQKINAKCGAMFPWKNIRLPKDVVPLRYKLWLHPNLTKLSLKGNVEIDVLVMNKTNLLMIHQQSLNITYFSLRIDSQSVPIRLATCDFLNQWAFMLDRKLLPEQKVTIKIDFNTIIPESIMAGLYANRHIDHRTNTRAISAVTQFEPTHARRAFPCFDEPNFKAIFEISIVHEPNHVARANMHLERSEIYNTIYVVDHFAPTLRMSTYILAFAVLDNFNKVRQMTRKTRMPIEVNVFAATPDYKEQSMFAMDTAIRALEFFEVFFDIPFPLQKTDLVALDDFAEGAMEVRHVCSAFFEKLLFRSCMSAVFIWNACFLMLLDNRLAFTTNHCYHLSHKSQTEKQLIPCALF